MLRGEATNTNFIVFVWPDRGSKPHSTTLERSTLTIAPPIRFLVIWLLFYCDLPELFITISHIYALTSYSAWYRSPSSWQDMFCLLWSNHTFSAFITCHRLFSLVAIQMPLLKKKVIPLGRYGSNCFIQTILMFYLTF